MSGFRNDSDRAAADASVERALASVHRRAPRPEFLRELKGRFTSAASASAAGVPSVAPAAAPVHQIPRPARPSSRPPLSGWTIAAGVVVIAASALAIFALRGSDARRWTPVEGRIPRSPLSVDGRAVLPRDLATALLSDTVPHTIATGTEPLWVQLGASVICEMAPDSEVEFGALAPSDRPLLLVARKGTLRVRTGEEFQGSTMNVRTPEFELVVTGTSFAIDIDEEGTCVCCLQGRVVLKAPEAFDESWAVDSGRMCRIYDDNRAPKWDEVSHKHGPALERFHELADELMQ